MRKKNAQKEKLQQRADTSSSYTSEGEISLPSLEKTDNTTQTNETADSEKEPPAE